MVSKTSISLACVASSMITLLNLKDFKALLYIALQVVMITGVYPIINFSCSALIFKNLSN